MVNAADEVGEAYGEIRGLILRRWWENVLLGTGPRPVESVGLGPSAPNLARTHTRVVERGITHNREADRAWVWAGLERKRPGRARWVVVDSVASPPPGDVVDQLHDRGLTVEAQLRKHGLDDLVPGAVAVENRVRTQRTRTAPSSDRTPPPTDPGAAETHTEERNRLEGRPFNQAAESGRLPAVPASANISDEEWDRAHAAHPATVAALAGHVTETFGAVPYEPAAREPQFDLAWQHDNTLWVAEVKSLPATETGQRGKLRLGLGQVLDYRRRLASTKIAPTQAVLAVEIEPVDHETWTLIASDVGVILAWPDVFRERLTPTTGVWPLLPSNQPPW